MASTNKKILIVEDDESLLDILKQSFVGEGISVVTAENGEEGIRVAEKEKPDLVISDLLMPKMDGLEMAKRIRQSDNSIEIIFLTNIKETDSAENVKKSGDFEYLIKSDLEISDIVKKVKNKLGLK